MEKKISINTLIADNKALSTEDGIKVFNQIKKAIDNNVVAVLSFEKIDLLTSAFLNAAIGQLYGVYVSDEIKNKLKLIDYQDSDLELIKKVIERAKEYFKNNKNISESVEKGFNK